MCNIFLSTLHNPSRSICYLAQGSEETEVPHKNRILDPCLLPRSKIRWIESLSPSPSGRPPWDLISEKYCMVVNGERQQIFWSRLNCALIYTYDVYQFKRYILKSRKSQLDVKLLRYKTVKIRNYKDYKPRRRTCDVIPFLSMNEANFTEANVCHFFYSLTL